MSGFSRENSGGVSNRARPCFTGSFHRAEVAIRGYRVDCCLPPPNDIPERWFDGGEGWVTRYFTDIQPYVHDEQKAGKHRCIVAKADGSGGECGFEVEGDTYCTCSGCFVPKGDAPALMAAHLVDHGIMPPARQPWRHGLFEIDKTFIDSWFCLPCQGSRQLRATYGYKDSLSIMWLLVFIFTGGAYANGKGAGGGGWCPPILFASFLTRMRIRTFHNLDEGFCTMMAIAVCCPACSLAQSNKEFTAGGVWPGGTILQGSGPPAVTATTPLTGSMM